MACARGPQSSSLTDLSGHLPGLSPPSNWCCQVLRSLQISCQPPPHPLLVLASRSGGPVPWDSDSYHSPFVGAGPACPLTRNTTMRPRTACSAGVTARQKGPWLPSQCSGCEARLRHWQHMTGGIASPLQVTSSIRKWGLGQWPRSFFLILRELYTELPIKFLLSDVHGAQEVCGQEVVTVSAFHHTVDLEMTVGNG